MCKINIVTELVRISIKDTDVLAFEEQRKIYYYNRNSLKKYVPETMHSYCFFTQLLAQNKV